MYIQKLIIKNYRNFGITPFVIELKPFTLILGENNIGKTNLLNAVALLFSQDIGVFQRRVLELDDFNYSTVAAFKKASSGMFRQFFIERDKGPIHPDGRRCPT